MNREVAKINGELPPITKSRGTVGAYEIANSTYQALDTKFP
ncbi:MAG TPA: hypothetical protein VIM10_03020 [Actinopolymorphaceae bacterium]